VPEDTPGDSLQFWNEMWAEHGGDDAGPDELLVSETEGLTPGRALELGCGIGGNAVWLAEQGWTVTAVDFAEPAVQRALQLAESHRVDVEFVVADAAAYEPHDEFDLVTSFYIQLPADQRAAMMAMASAALASGGTLLFASHDRSGSPPEGWTDEDLTTLTTPEQVVAELPGLLVEKAIVIDATEAAAHASEGNDGEAEHEPRHDSDDRPPHRFRNTVVRATRP
jgi:SAM-dependent methyltransferase